MKARRKQASSTKTAHKRLRKGQAPKKAAPAISTGDNAPFAHNDDGTQGKKVARKMAAVPLTTSALEVPAGANGSDLRERGALPVESSPSTAATSAAAARLAMRRLTEHLAPPNLPTVQLAGVELHCITEQQAVETIIAELECGYGGVVVTPNLDHVYRCTKNVTFAALVAEADLVVADGTPLVWASILKGTRLPERVAGSNLIYSLSAAAAAAGRRVYLLGGDPGTAEGAARALQERYPDLIVAGTHCPPRDFEYDSTQMAILVERLKAARPDIVFVALGSPKQEKLVNQIKRTLPRAWWLGVGISFSFLSGQVRRAPVWMQRYGLEWMHRLSQEPRRLFRRYIVTGIPFASRLMISALAARVARKVGLVRSEPMKRQAGTLRLIELLDEKARSDGDQNALSVERAALGKGRITAELRDDLSEVRLEGQEARPDAAAVLARVRALVLLGGTVRPGSLARGCGRPTLELPVTQSLRLMDHWLANAQEVAHLAGLASLPVRVVVSDETDAPHTNGTLEKLALSRAAYSVERDLSEYRGTGGVLRDLAGEYGDDDLLLVCNAAQVLMEPLTVIARALAHKGADVALVAHDDGTPTGAMLLSVKTLRLISSVGYVDMKEQALPRIAREFSVRAVRCRRPSALPVRTAESYIRALAQYHEKQQHRGRGAEPDPMTEDFSKHFAIVEPDAYVHPSAYLHDTVVLAGGKVEAGATVVRSLVCAGGVVPRDGRALDVLVAPQARRSLTTKG